MAPGFAPIFAGSIGLTGFHKLLNHSTNVYRMKNLYFLNAAFCLLMTVEIREGCNNANPPQEKPIALETAVWQLTDILTKPVPMRVPDSLAVPITIKFSGGNFEGFGGCNGIGGEYTATGKQLTVTGVIRTEMYCEGASDWENMFIQRLQYSRSYRITGETLEIDCGAMGGLKFRLNWKKRKG